ncbi:GTP pyrophosphokinase family protein [Pseudomonas iridis]|uniref:GTP pyrophosphokinase n=1 Tax=Pseudomonas iridis TaxID=2710587 RepID=UPI0037F60DD7
MLTFNSEVQVTDILQQYRDVKPRFERLRVNIKDVLEQIITENKIPVFAIESRLKDEESLADKMIRKDYDSPLEDIDDLCGVRVICYYQEDIKNIREIVESEFDVLKKEDKKDSLNDNQFGYTSYHYVISLKKEWLAHPGARGLEGLRAEIQIRTMLMHTWSAISHKLLYKREADVPPQFKRQLNRLSALIELADEQFDAIKNVKSQYVMGLALSEQTVDVAEELNSDSLLAVQQNYFKDRLYRDSEIPTLLQEIRLAGYTLNQFVEKVELCLPVLNAMESAEAVEVGKAPPLWNFAGVVRTVLDLTSDSYYQERYLPEYLSVIRDRYREALKQS